MNRTDRLYAIVEELRAVAPQARTALQLARRFEVSIRTIERDVLALLESGVPIYATRGRGGGYAVDKAMTLPPVNFTPSEAAALAVALARPGATPLGVAARSARQKVVAAMRSADAEAADRLAERIKLLDGAVGDTASVGAAPVSAAAVEAAVAATVERAVVERRVVAIAYADRAGQHTERVVEPVAFVGAERNWYLVGYCRLREAGRSFRLDRIRSAELTPEPSPERAFDSVAGDIAGLVSRPPLLE